MYMYSSLPLQCMLSIVLLSKEHVIERVKKKKGKRKKKKNFAVEKCDKNYLKPSDHG